MSNNPFFTTDLLQRLVKRIRYESHLYFRYYPREILHRLSARFNSLHGITKEKRGQQLIISMTTIPERIEVVHICIDTLLRQSVKPDRIILWLSEVDLNGRQVINKQKLPVVLLGLQKRGLEIRWTRDIRSYRKLLPALKKYPGSLIVTADDDFFYPRDWLKDLYEAYRHEPQYIHCHRAHLMSHDGNGSLAPYNRWNWFANGIKGPDHLLFPTSGAGALFAPEHLDQEVFNEDVFSNLCPNADDIWFKAMALKAGVLSKKVRPFSSENTVIRNSQQVALAKQNVAENKNDTQLKATFDRYQLWEIIK